MSQDSGDFAAPWASPSATNPVPQPPVTPENTAPTAPQEAPKAEAQKAPESAPTPEETAPKEGYVTVTVPKAYKFFVDAHKEVHYSAGVQEMLESHADHWYSKANGVEKYVPKKPD